MTRKNATAIIYDRASSAHQKDNWSRQDAESTGADLAQKYDFDHWELRQEVASGEELTNRPVMQAILEEICRGKAAFEQIADAVDTNDFRSLPSGAVNSLRKIASFTRRRNCEADFLTKNGIHTLLATITPSTEIEPIPLLTGETVIYGKIVRVGGRTPRVMVETVDGQTVYCDTSWELAPELGGKLYTSVSLHGIAKWDSSSFTLEEFRVERIEEYEEEKPISQAIGELSKVVGEYFSDITDVEQYVKELRSDYVGGEL